MVCWFFFMALLPLPLNGIAFAEAAQSLIPPLAAVTLILTQIIAPRFLEGESVSKSEFLGSALIIAGVIMTSVFGPYTQQDLNLDDLKPYFEIQLQLGWKFLQLRVWEFV